MGLLSDARSALSWAYAPAIRSPWAPNPSHLESFVWQDILGTDVEFPLTRVAAMRIPAVKRSRNLLCETIAQIPLIAKRGDSDVSDQFGWLRRTDRDVSMAHTIVWTADDLLFRGWSLWQVDRNRDRTVAHVWRIDPARWDIAADGTLSIDGKPVPPNFGDRYCLIPAFNEGILASGSDTLRDAQDLARAARNAAYAPSPTMELHYTGKTELADSEIDKLIGRWAAARRGKNGGVAYTSANIETKQHGAVDEHLLIEGRTAMKVEIANLMGIPSAMLDAPTGDPLTYATSKDKRDELIDFGCAPIMAAISARLSLDDMVPRGTTIMFEREDEIGAQRDTGAAETSNAPQGPGVGPGLKPVPNEGEAA